MTNKAVSDTKFGTTAFSVGSIANRQAPLAMVIPKVQGSNTNTWNYSTAGLAPAVISEGDPHGTPAFDPTKQATLSYVEMEVPFGFTDKAIALGAVANSPLSESDLLANEMQNACDALLKKINNFVFQDASQGLGLVSAESGAYAGVDPGSNPEWVGLVWGGNGTSHSDSNNGTATSLSKQTIRNFHDDANSRGNGAITLLTGHFAAVNAACALWDNNVQYPSFPDAPGLRLRQIDGIDLLPTDADGYLTSDTAATYSLFALPINPGNALAGAHFRVVSYKDDVNTVKNINVAGFPVQIQQSPAASHNKVFVARTMFAFVVPKRNSVARLRDIKVV